MCPMDNLGLSPLRIWLSPNVQRETTFPEGECLVGRPRPLSIRGGGGGNGERTRVASPPQGACRATDRSRSPVAASLSLLVPLDLVCVRALPAGEPAEGRAFHAR